MELFQSHDFNDRLPEALLDLLQQEPVVSHAYVVGGFVRDALLGEPSKDIDIEVFGTSYAKLASALERWGRVDQVGRSFGVIKLTLPGCKAIDFTIPRQDAKINPGHRGFSVQFSQNMTQQEAVTRRDFTINALFYDPRERYVMDCVNGLEDLSQKRLRVVDRTSFAEDPLRVLRAMQFASRFDLEIDAELLSLSQEMFPSFTELAKERICEEWLKWAAKSRRPSAGLEFLLRCRWIEHFPELSAIVDVPQDPEWHPEGDVFAHTCYCCDALSELPEWKCLPPGDRSVYLMATLLHDLGKATTTVEALRNGSLRVVSPGHEQVGGRWAKNFLARLGVPHAFHQRVIPLVANHMVHLHEPTDRAIRRLAYRLQPETIKGLCMVMKADSLGRPPKPKTIPESIRQLQKRSESLELEQAAPKNILQGRDLLRLGIKPGPKMGEILAKVFNAQLDGQITTRESAIAWAQSKKLIQ
ncbi:MAG: Multifunctional CCA protein [Verrucomicrobia subdivision 3 bacterium]|nr:Multifunctional CCA protein [Limisphaerales bacterium]MCS1413029.1 Multifunctional CCA protein [Limisphaerales bacterium]